VRRADNLTTFMCRLSRNSGASTSRNPKGLSRPVAGKLYLYRVQYGTTVVKSCLRCRETYPTFTTSSKAWSMLLLIVERTSCYRTTGKTAWSSSAVNQLDAADIILMDGTFDYCPTFFAQVCTIHFAANKLHVLLLFCLLTNTL
jgi:hypothetical protein